MKSATPPRAYRMTTRAETAEATRRRILDAAILAFSEHPYDEVVLAEVAAKGGVTVQTVLRRFGSKEGLVRAATERAVAEVRNARFAACPGDLDGTIRGLVDHYETWGQRSLRLLAQEERVPAIRDAVAVARELHRDWVSHAFGPWLARTRGSSRERLQARLVAVTDVYVWKILRRDLGLDRPTTERTLRELLAAIVA